MLSKEEIEISNIEVPIPLNSEELEREYRDLYIRHKILLGEKQNLIEKLEERIKEYKEKSGGNTYHIQSMINAEIRELEWILSILKG